MYKNSLHINGSKQNQIGNLVNNRLIQGRNQNKTHVFRSNICFPIFHHHRRRHHHHRRRRRQACMFILLQLSQFRSCVKDEEAVLGCSS